METLRYENKPVPSIIEDHWKVKPSDKKPVFQKQNISYQRVQMIVQFFSSNYIQSAEKKKG